LCSEARGRCPFRSAVGWDGATGGAASWRKHGSGPARREETAISRDESDPKPGDDGARRRGEDEEAAKRLLPDPDLESLIQKLNTSARQIDPLVTPEAEAVPDAPVRRGPSPPSRWTLPAADDEGRDRLRQLLANSRGAHASDLLLVAGTRPTMRVNGRLVPVGGQALTPDEAASLCAALVPPTHAERLGTSGAVDFALTRKGIGRFRCNVHRAQDRWSAALRLLPERVPDFETLHLPATLKRFAEMTYGLVLVTGPTGSGKSTTLASLMRHVLSRRRVHVITIEDPVEYTHGHGDSVVEHIEIGRDAPSFASALRSALRQDPDVLLIGEMRDPESISIAITAAETGHLVLSTLHTGDAPQTVHRILDSYPAGQTEQVRVQLSVSLAGIVSQQLLPRRDGRGRVPAVEIMVATHAVRNLIRQGKIAHLRSQLTLERPAGMLGLDASLARLVGEGLVDRELARARARVPEEFDHLLLKYS
jgi:twitching motility protein PilT